ncbi:MAG: hypothetical protein V3W04_15195 [Gammaproteobacteria bacterium]
MPDKTEVSIHTNPQTGLSTWTADSPGFRIELIQLVPDFVRAVYGSHHFPAEEIERIAAFCVFGTVLKNTSNKPLSYRVADWYFIDADGEQHPVKTKTQWIEEWRKAGIPFSWTLLPDAGTFENGDWQQGFTTINTPADQPFELVYAWEAGGKRHEGRIKNLHCAERT